MNVLLLKSKLALNNMNQDKLAEKLNLTPASISKRMNGELDFKIKEIEVVQDLLNLTSNEIIQIFFNDNLREKYEGREVCENKGGGAKDE